MDILTSKNILNLLKSSYQVTNLYKELMRSESYFIDFVYVVKQYPHTIKHRRFNKKYYYKY